MSREKIVARTLELLQEMRAEDLSMHKLAKSLSIGTMTLYVYFNNREELLQAASEHVLTEVDLSAVTAAADWQTALREWAMAIRKVFVSNAEVVELIRSFTSVPYSWFELEVHMIDLLRTIGLTGSVLRDTARWAAREVIGAILLELNMRRIFSADQAAAQKDASKHISERLSPKAREILDMWPTYIEDYSNHDRNFEFSMARVIDAIEAVKGQAGQ